MGPNSPNSPSQLCFLCKLIIWGTFVDGKLTNAQLVPGFFSAPLVSPFLIPVCHQASHLASVPSTIYYSINAPPTGRLLVLGLFPAFSHLSNVHTLCGSVCAGNPSIWAWVAQCLPAHFLSDYPGPQNVTSCVLSSLGIHPVHIHTHCSELNCDPLIPLIC
jgi:hypothetical protein